MAGCEVEWMPLDLTLSDSAVTLFEAVSRRFGKAHVLINNACFWLGDSNRHTRRWVAGSPLRGEHSRSNIIERGVRPPLCSKGCSSDHFDDFGQMLGPMAGSIAYAASKGALDAFTITLADEVGKYGITVNAVDPGPTDTGWMTQEKRQELLPRYSLGRLGTPEDAAQLVAFLISSEADWITGQTIRSRGGFY